MRAWYLNQDLVTNADERVIKIEGNVITPKYKIVDLIRQVQLPNVQIFRLDTSEMEQNIMQLQPIRKVYIRRFWFPARLKVVVEERVPVFLITPSLESEAISAISADGVLIDREYMPISTKFKTYKIITYGVRGDDYEKWTKERVNEILKLAKALETYSHQNVLYIDLRNPTDVYIKLEKVLIRFGEINDTSLNRAKWIATIIPETKNFGKRIKYIDLRWEDAHYIKLEDTSQNTKEEKKDDDKDNNNAQEENER